MWSIFGASPTEEEILAVRGLFRFSVVRLAASLHAHRERHEVLFRSVSRLVDEAVEFDPLSMIISAKQSTIHNSYKRDLLAKCVAIYVKKHAITDTDG